MIMFIPHGRHCTVCSILMSCSKDMHSFLCPPKHINPGVNKKPFAWPFQARQFQNPDVLQTVSDFFLLITDNFGPNRFGKICAEVTFSVKENIKQAFLRERQIYSPYGTIVSFDSCS